MFRLGMGHGRKRATAVDCDYSGLGWTVLECGGLCWTAMECGRLRVLLLKTGDGTPCFGRYGRKSGATEARSTRPTNEDIDVCT